MPESIESILTNVDFQNYQLNESDEALRRIMDTHSTEIENISNMEDRNIEINLTDLLNLGSEDPKYKLYLSNLLYIKQSFFIDKKEREKDILNIDLFKELKLEEIISADDFQEGQSLSINFDSVKDLIEKKMEEEEKWKDYNIVSTVASLIGLPEDNIQFISKLSEYISFVSELSPAVNFVSRGQKDCTYPLLPSLHRRHKKDYEIHSNVYEGAFKQKIIYYDKEIKNKSIEEIRAEGQHFGLPTDYLDFTEAHLISLLFAIEDYTYIKQHSIVYFINAVNYNSDTVEKREKLIDYSDSTIIESLKKFSSRSYFIKLGNSNERIHFQKGCFLKVSTQDKEEFKKKIAEHCKVIIISKDSKKEILKELFNLGITFENIYPDKDNVVKSIRFYYEELQGGSNL